MRYTGFHRLMRLVHRGEVQNSWQVHLGNEIIADQLDLLRQQYKDLNSPPPSYTALVIKAIGLAMRQVSRDYPEINSMIAGFPGFRRIHTFDQITAGVAVSRIENDRDSVVVGVIENPETRLLSSITTELKQLGTLPVKDVPGMRNCYYLYRAPLPIQWFMAKMGSAVPNLRQKYRGTFSLTTVGKFGVDWQLSLPQAGSTLQFGFGEVRSRPVVRNGEVVAARTFNLIGAFDRLVMNGKPVALLMELVREILNKADFKDDKEALQAQASGMNQPAQPDATTTTDHSSEDKNRQPSGSLST